MYFCVDKNPLENLDKNEISKETKSPYNPELLK